jgi:hypothetical protein
VAPCLEDGEVSCRAQAAAAGGILPAATSPGTVFVVAGAGVPAVLLLVRVMLTGSLAEADAG